MNNAGLESSIYEQLRGYSEALNHYLVKLKTDSPSPRFVPPREVADLIRGLGESVPDEVSVQLLSSGLQERGAFPPQRCETPAGNARLPNHGQGNGRRPRAARPLFGPAPSRRVRSVTSDAMNEKHFHATLTQIEERARRLLGGMPLRVDGMDALAESCRRDLDSVIYSAQQLRDDAQFKHEAVQTERLQLLRNLFGQLDVLESTAVAALQRINNEDRRMTRTVQALADECHFPLPAPVVSCTSQDYFNIDTRLRLVQMPLTDGRHLLHLPDLAHEMAHILLADLNNPKSSPFKQAMREVKARVIKHFDARGKNLALGRSPTALVTRIPVWWKSWMDAWVVEFFCDLFGVFSVGPAYGWAHLHLCMRQPTDSYHYPTFNTTSHPANAARTAVIIDGLRLAGFNSAADELAQAWQQLLRITGEKADSDFAECYPAELMRSTAEFGFKGYRAIGCRVITTASMGTCQRLLNDAWNQFRTQPENYPAWETTAMGKFYGQ